MSGQLFQPSKDSGYVANCVDVSDRFFNGYYSDSIGCIRQRDAQFEQQMFPIDPGFDAEFIVNLKDHERVVRLSTPLSSPDHGSHRHIAKISIKTGRVSHPDADLYINEGVVEWQRGLKAIFITIPPASQAYFGVL